MPTSDKKRIKPVIEEIEPVEPEPEPPVSPSAPEATPEPEKSVDPPQPKEPEAEAQVPSAESRRMNLKLIIIITLLSALVAAFVSGGVYVYLSGVQSMETSEEEKTEISLTPETSPTPEASATPTPAAVDISKLSVQVLNGSGAIGVAGAAKDVLTKAGFTVAQTGNAGRYDYKNTTIQVKPSVNAETVEMLKKSLEDADYTVEVGSALPASSQYDISVIVGAN